MPTYESTSSAEERAEELRGLEGQERADAAFEQQLAIEKNLGALRSGTRSDVAELLEGDDEAEARAAQIQEGLDETIAAGDADIGIDHDMAGTSQLGVNHGLTTQAEISPDVLTAEQMAEKPDEAVIVAAHERSEEIGHAGQEEVAGLVDTDGEAVETTLILEGDVESGTAAKYGERESQPEAVYGEGQEFVERAGKEQIHAYTHGEADRVDTQAAILEKSSMDTEQMQHALQQNGFADTETEEIVRRARGANAGVEEQEDEPQLAMAG
jgi:hypothetical protein